MIKRSINDECLNKNKTRKSLAVINLACNAKTPQPHEAVTVNSAGLSSQIEYRQTFTGSFLYKYL